MWPTAFGTTFDLSAILKSFVFSILLSCFKIIEEFAVDMFHGASFRASIESIANGSWSMVAASTVLLFVVLIPFFGFSELRNILGEERLLGRIFPRAPFVESTAGRIVTEDPLASSN